MARKTCQINPLSFFDRIIDRLMETTVGIQKQFNSSKVFGLVSQGILIKTYSCVRRNKQLSRLQVWLHLFLERICRDWVSTESCSVLLATVYMKTWLVECEEGTSML